MANKITQLSFEFKRRIDGVVYRFHPCQPIDGQIAWKREDIDLWVTRIERFGWVCIDSNKIILGIPWGVGVNHLLQENGLAKKAINPMFTMLPMLNIN